MIVLVDPTAKVGFVAASEVASVPLIKTDWAVKVTGELPTFWTYRFNVPSVLLETLWICIALPVFSV